jgi:hypothetical protein
MDQAQTLLDVLRGLCVDGDQISTGCDKIVQIALGIDDHQMYVKEKISMLAQGTDDGRAKADIGDEHAVHDVKVQPIGATLLYAANLIGKAGKIGGQKGWGNV